MMSKLSDMNANQCQSSDELPTVVVTGFGLFRDYKVNPSWESVKLLKLKNVKLVTKEIPVVYDDVDRYVSEIWSDYKPKLVVHCGVSCMAQCITIETRALNNRSLYTKPDVCGRVPDTQSQHLPSAPNSLPKQNKCEKIPESDPKNCIRCKINIENVCEKVNRQFQEGSIKMPAVMSSNAGRYLCEYIFYSSLSQSPEQTAFIHVPEISEKCPLEDIASAVQFTVQSLVEEVIQSDNSITK